MLGRVSDVRSPGGSSSLQSAVNTLVHVLKSGSLRCCRKTKRNRVANVAKGSRTHENNREKKRDRKRERTREKERGERGTASFGLFVGSPP